MKKLLLIVPIVLLLFSCGGVNYYETDFKTHPEAFKAFKDAVERKDTATLKSLSSVDFPYFDTLMNNFNEPRIMLVPQEDDGAFGVIDKGDYCIYYVFVLDSNKPKDVRGIMFKKVDEYYKIWNASNIRGREEILLSFPSGRMKQSDASKEKSQPTKIVYQTGVINTIADGYDVERVNLWSSCESDRKIVCSLNKGHKVKIIDENYDYYKLESSKGTGWCMKDFVENIK